MVFHRNVLENRSCHMMEVARDGTGRENVPSRRVFSRLEHVPVLLRPVRTGEYSKL